jgi:hypothetical protein
MRIEIINELFFMLAFYSYLSMSNFNNSVESQFMIGYVYIGIIALCFLYNLNVMINSLFRSIKMSLLRKKHEKKLKI